MELTIEQKLILDNADSNLFINAGPGAGKSSVLGLICEKLLLNPANFVLLLTFTNKASKSIISKCSNVDQSKVLGGTFHGIAYRLLRKNGVDNFICDENKKRLIIKKIFNCKADRDKFEKLYSIISLTKSKYPLVKSDIINKYQSELKKYKLSDFDDIIYDFISYCRIDGFGLPQISHILCDELQDTSGPQFEMIKEIQKKTNCKIVGVGDIDQNIYNFRGSRLENIKDLIKIFDCKTYEMGTNFRSCAKIVKHSKLLIELNKDRIPKSLKAFKSDQGLISKQGCNSQFDEIDQIVKLCNINKGREIAILYRNRTFKNYLEFELQKAGFKYEVNDVLELADRSAIKCMLSILKICTGEFDIYDLVNAAKCIKGFGNASAIKLELAAKDKSLSLVFNEQKDNKRLKSLFKLQEYFNAHQQQNLALLVTEIGKYFINSFNYASEMEEFIVDISKDYIISLEDIKRLCNELGLDDKEEHKDENALIHLSTLHSSKGLEYDTVIMPWCQQYLEPKPGKIIEIEEERRLFYVGITRAKNKLYLVYSGEMPRFIKEMKL